MRQIVCERCQRRAKEDTQAGWYRVESSGIDIRRYGDEAGPWDLCSWDCLAEWATGHVKVP